MKRRLLLLGAAGSIAGLISSAFFPVSFTAVRLALVLSALVLWICVLLLLKPARRARQVFLGLSLLAAVPFTLPGRKPDLPALERDYTAGLLAREGTPYLWGGESARGIDCSGLPRLAWRRALLRQGLLRLDGGALREAARQWWFDTSARALGEGYRGFTAPLNLSGTVATLDPAPLRPGDLAVTDNGVHVLVYAGSGNWIQADPGAGRVLTLHGRTGQNPWFRVPVSLHRWTRLMPP